MAYAILRAAKYKTAISITNMTKHHIRAGTKLPKGVDPKKSHLNIFDAAINPKYIHDKIKVKMKACTRVRPDANKVVEMFYSASGEYFKDKTREEQIKYLQDCLDFTKEFAGEENIISHFMHFDEKTPHIHVFFVPLETSERKTKHTKSIETTLNAKHYLGGSTAMVELQDKFHAFVVSRGHDLERGVSKKETKAVHVPVEEYWNEKIKEADRLSSAAVLELDTAQQARQEAVRLRDEAEAEKKATRVLYEEALRAKKDAEEKLQAAQEWNRLGAQMYYENQQHRQQLEEFESVMAGFGYTLPNKLSPPIDYEEMARSMGYPQKPNDYSTELTFGT